MQKTAVLTVLLLFITVTNIVKASPLGQLEEEGQVYIIQAGDSLSKLAGKFYGDSLYWPVIQEATNTKATQDHSFTFITNPKYLLNNPG